MSYRIAAPEETIWEPPEAIIGPYWGPLETTGQPEFGVRPLIEAALEQGYSLTPYSSPSLPPVETLPPLDTGISTTSPGQDVDDLGDPVYDPRPDEPPLPELPHVEDSWLWTLFQRTGNVWGIVDDPDANFTPYTGPATVIGPPVTAVLPEEPVSIWGDLINNVVGGLVQGLANNAFNDDETSNLPALPGSGYTTGGSFGTDQYGMPYNLGGARRRRMDPCNSKALMRAARRLTMYARMNKRVDKALRRAVPARLRGGAYHRKGKR